MNFLARAWHQLSLFGAPAALPDLLPAPPSRLPGAEAREPVSDHDRAAAQLRIEHRRWAMDTLCQLANSHVYRDYGAGAVVEHDSPGQVIEIPASMVSLLKEPLDFAKEIDHVVNCRDPDQL